ncbi:cyclase family protein [Deinococcus sp. SM5_A1]|uniref:cyclase family protein n=1 Tax=Deinococcus sp. SM5_A1 TaxID=3379094 RepID=UPI003858DEB3
MEITRQVSQALVTGSGTPAPEQPAPSNPPPVFAFDPRRLHDLTHIITPSFPMFPAFGAVERRQTQDLDTDGFFANSWQLSEHVGTHLDAPAHFIAGGQTAEHLPVDQFIAPAVVLDVSGRADHDHDFLLSVDDVCGWERTHGRIPAGALVLMHSGWSRHVHDPQQFLGFDGAGTMHFPGFSSEAAQFLTHERHVVGAGVDTLSVDGGGGGSAAAHIAFLGAGKWCLENVAHLEALPPVGAVVIVGALRLEGSSGSPVRMLASW